MYWVDFSSEIGTGQLKQIYSENKEKGILGEFLAS